MKGGGRGGSVYSMLEILLFRFLLQVTSLLVRVVMNPLIRCVPLIKKHVESLGFPTSSLNLSLFLCVRAAVGVRGDVSGTTRDHPVPGQSADKEATRGRGHDVQAPPPGGEARQGSGGDQPQQRQAVRGEHARAAGTQTGAGGLPGGAGLHSHPCVS